MRNTEMVPNAPDINTRLLRRYSQSTPENLRKGWTGRSLHQSMASQQPAINTEWNLSNRRRPETQDNDCLEELDGLRDHQHRRLDECLRFPEELGGKIISKLLGCVSHGYEKDAAE